MSEAFQPAEPYVRYKKALAHFDSKPPEVRELMREFGAPIVNACLIANVKTSFIRDLVLEIWAGARQQDQRGGAEGTLDWVISQAGAQISAARLEAILQDFSLKIVPATPTNEMIEASMAEVSDFSERITKREKHRRRLMAAVKACPRRFGVRRANLCGNED